MIRPLTLALLLASAAWSAQAQELLIRGGTIYTGVEAQPTAEVVLVQDGRIAYVGTEAGLPTFAYAETLDLRGATMFPGFTDGHAHLDGIGWRELTLNLEGSASVAEAMARLAAWAGAHPEGPIVGRGWIETHWPEARFLTAADLDAAAPGRIVLLGRSDGHAVVASSTALAAAGVDASTVAPTGGEILKGPDGRPTGLLVDAAEQLVAGLLPQTDPEALRDALYRQAFGPVRWVECVQAIQARGITTLVECGPGKVLAGMTKRIDAGLTGVALYDPATLAEVKTLLA
jgi:predicted amidohydrolase YtcJ